MTNARRTVIIAYRVMWPDGSLAWLRTAEEWLRAVRHGAIPVSPKDSDASARYATLRDEKV